MVLRATLKLRVFAALFLLPPPIEEDATDGADRADDPRQEVSEKCTDHLAARSPMIARPPLMSMAGVMPP